MGSIADSASAIRFRFEGEPMTALAGESVAAALLAGGRRVLRYHEESGSPRGLYCNIGHCMECRMTIDGREGVRACLTPVADGMDVRTGMSLPAPLRKTEGGENR